MLKLIVFDLDGTLSEDGYSAIPEKELSRIKNIENCGVKIAICSGKPTHFLCGFLRQCDWKTPIMMGENGAVIQFGIFTPPTFFHVLPYSDDAKKSLAFLKEEIERRIPDMWFQPGLTAVTPFPKKDEEFDIIDDILKQNRDRLKDIIYYKHRDCYDAVPSGLNKGTAVEWLSKKLGIDITDAATVGDGINDYCMFEKVEHSFGINLPDKTKAKYNFDSLSDVLTYIENELLK